jgi:hypothetical protein
VTDEQRSMAAKGQGLGCQEFRSWGTNIKRSKNHGFICFLTLHQAEKT